MHGKNWLASIVGFALILLAGSVLRAAGPGALVITNNLNQPVECSCYYPMAKFTVPAKGKLTLAPSEFNKVMIQFQRLGSLTSVDTAFLKQGRQGSFSLGKDVNGNYGLMITEGQINFPPSKSREPYFGPILLDSNNPPAGETVNHGGKTYPRVDLSKYFAYPLYIPSF